MSDHIAILGAARTPMGGLGGSLLAKSSPELGGTAISGALADAGIKADDVDELVMGCVLAAGLGQAPARQAGFAAGLGKDVPATTLNKMCGSGMQTVMTACDQLSLGRANVMVAGGMESMSNAPYLLPKMRQGARLGHGQVMDHMFFDGLEDAYEKGRLMGTFAEDCAQSYQFTREAQDDFALKSLSRALAAQESGVLEREISPVVVKTRKSETTVSTDEQPANARPEKIPTLKPAFAADGTVTAANASSISDGAAALVLAPESVAKQKGAAVRALIKGYKSYAQEPALFTTAPVFAARNLLDQLGWSVDDVDLWEVNEAFAVVPMAFMRDLQIDHAKVNIYGGACALGHPIGASGTRILVTLLNALEQTGGKRGVAAICIGGGEATAMAIELP
ncbi:MAG: acetyl-CoA C-acyltransferase [Rhodobacteraceae bacterium]|nr:acetyl-CoA C-acyltransferase [Paracoccaceae bacterium]